MQLTRCEPGKTRIGWIGTGVMGSPMCGHLLAKGYSTLVYSRTKSKTDALVAKGATWCDSPTKLVDESDVVITIVGFPEDVRDVYLGKGAVVARARAGMLLIDMSTSGPMLADEIATAAFANGAYSLDAPVSGGDVGAREARLSIMVGGDPAAFQAALPIFETLGTTIRHQGPPGAGQHTKMVNQMLIATNMIGVCESLLYAHKAGLNPAKVIESVGSGAAGSWTINNLGPRILKRDFEPGFFVEHFIKDMGIALAEAKRMKLALPGLALAEQLYHAVAANGYSRKGTQALMLALEKLNGINEK